jgi:hypothetical protein
VGFVRRFDIAIGMSELPMPLMLVHEGARFGRAGWQLIETELPELLTGYLYFRFGDLLLSDPL